MIYDTITQTERAVKNLWSITFVRSEIISKSINIVAQYGIDPQCQNGFIKQTRIKSLFSWIL